MTNYSQASVTERRRSIEEYLIYSVRIIAALLLVAEVAILSAGVASRYLYNNPIIWIDEVASLIFLWLAMLGSVIAYYNTDHMMMSAVISKLPEKGQVFLKEFGHGFGLLFLFGLLLPSIEFAYEERLIISPTLDISNFWRAAAMPTGIALMLLIGIGQVFDGAFLRRRLVPFLIAALIVLALWYMKPLLMALGKINLIIFFVFIVAILVLMAVPIAFAFGLSTFGYITLTTRMPVEVIVSRMDEGMSHLILLSIPLFVFLGLLIELTGMARAMVGFLASMLAHVRGGLSYVLIGAMYLVSGISGSKAADMAAVAPVLFPEMRKRGAKEGDLLALLSATGAQTETIPPSIVLITIGSVTGVSISALFTGGLVPGLVLGVTLCLLVWFRYRNEDLTDVPHPDIKKIGKALIFAAPALLLPFVIRAAVVEGVATATEVSTIGIAYTIIAGILIYREFPLQKVFPILVATVSLSGSILLIIGAATAMAWALTQSGFSSLLTSLVKDIPGGSISFLLISAVAFVILGSVLEGIPAIVLFGPLMFPIAKIAGIHEVHYAMVVVLAMGIGLFAPPFGVGYYAASAISRINPDKGMQPIVGYMLALCVGLALVIFFPWLSTGFL